MRKIARKKTDLKGKTPRYVGSVSLPRGRVASVYDHSKGSSTIVLDSKGNIEEASVYKRVKNRKKRSKKAKRKK